MIVIYSSCINSLFGLQVKVLNSLIGIFHQSETVKKYVQPRTQVLIVEKLCVLLSAVTIDDWLTSPLASICLGLVIRLHTHLLSALKNTEMLTVRCDEFFSCRLLL